MVTNAHTTRDFGPVGDTSYYILNVAAGYDIHAADAFYTRVDGELVDCGGIEGFPNGNRPPMGIVYCWSTIESPRTRNIGGDVFWMVVYSWLKVPGNLWLYRATSVNTCTPLSSFLRCETDHKLAIVEVQLSMTALN